MPLLNDNAIPYLVVLILMTLLSEPFFKSDSSCEHLTLRERRLGIRHVGLALSYLIYVGFAMFRVIDFGHGGTDAISYLNAFEEAGGYSFTAYMTSVTTFEPLYSAVSWALSTEFHDYRIALFFWHTLVFFFLARFMRVVLCGRCHTHLVIAAFFLLLFEMFNTLRMSIAISIAVNSLVSARDGKWTRAVLFVVLAAGVQASAAIMFPALAVVAVMRNRDGFSGLKFITVLAFIGILSAMSISLFASLLASFGKAGYIGTSAVSYGVYLSVIVITFLGFLNRKHLLDAGPMGLVLLASLPVCIICLPLQLNYSIVYRMTLYFLPITYAIMPMLWESYHQDGASGAYAAVFGVCNAYCIYRLVDFCTAEVFHPGLYAFAFF